MTSKFPYLSSVTLTFKLQVGPTGFGHYYWLGLRDVDQEGIYVWETSKQVATYTNFFNGSTPVDQELDCVYMMVRA